MGRIFLLLFMFPFFASAAADLGVPVIAVNPDIYYPLDELLYLEGRAKPSSAVQIQFQKPGAKPIKLVTKSDLNGEWVLAERVPLEAGDWEVRACAAEEGRSAECSNPRVIKAIVSGLVLGGVTVKFTFIFLLLFLAGCVIVYLLWRIRREARARTEVEIQQDFSELRRDVTEELKHLENKRELSQEEKEHRDKLLRELEQTERGIERRLKNM